MARSAAAKKRPAVAPAPSGPKLDTPADVDAFLAQFSTDELAEAIAALPAEHQAALEADLARGSFAEFVRQAWPLVPSVDPLVWGWHMDAICLHLEHVARGSITRLVINIPPGHAKSVLLSVLFPAWVWTWWPECQFLFATYSEKLTIRDSVRCRAVIESDWYRKAFSSPANADPARRWTLSHDQNAKDLFVNTKGGFRQSTSVGGAGSGLRAHIVGIDDPLNATDAHSKPKREEATQFIGQTLSTRLVDARTGRVAMIMQRLHAEDPSGWVLKGGGWMHLWLASEFEPARACATSIRVNGESVPLWKDPRSKPGELLFPERFPQDVLDVAKRPNELGALGFAGQHQQQPYPPGGNIFQTANWRFWKRDGDPDKQRRPPHCYPGPAIVLPSKFDKVILSVDANFKKTVAGSFVAIHIWARTGGRFFLLARVKKRMGFGETKREIRNLLGTLFGRMCRRKVVEGQANGDAIVDELQDEFPGFEAVDPRGGKEARAHAVEPYQTAGNCYLPDGAPWLDDFVVVLGGFPKGSEDDDVDAFSQALIDMEQINTTAQKWLMASGRSA